MKLPHDLLTLKPGVYDFLLSDEYSRSPIKCPGSSELYNGSEGGWDFEAQKSASIHHKKYSTQHRGVNKGLLKWIDAFRKKNINLKLYKA